MSAYLSSIRGELKVNLWEDHRDHSTPTWSKVTDSTSTSVNMVHSSEIAYMLQGFALRVYGLGPSEMCVCVLIYVCVCMYGLGPWRFN